MDFVKTSIISANINFSTRVIIWQLIAYYSAALVIVNMVCLLGDLEVSLIKKGSDFIRNLPEWMNSVVGLPPDVDQEPFDLIGPYLIFLVLSVHLGNAIQKWRQDESELDLHISGFQARGNSAVMPTTI